MNVVVSWSGGKDCCLAAYKAQAEGHHLDRIMNFCYDSVQRVTFHGTRCGLVLAQSRAMEIPLSQFMVPDDLHQYDAEFKRALCKLKKKGVEGVVFGDIFIEHHRTWAERMCAEVGLEALLPLWGINTEDVLGEFIDRGFRAVVVTVNGNVLDKEWLGRTTDSQFLQDLKALEPDHRIDVCGECGEYHTLAVDGPLFRQRLEPVRTEKVKRGKYFYLDISRCQLVAKE